MTEETKPDPREEIPHREQQIQWHEDMLHHLRTGEPMREWEYKERDLDWDICRGEPVWIKTNRYRRKPRTVTYWHCAAECVYKPTGKKEITVVRGSTKEDLDWDIKSLKSEYPTAKFSPIIETTVEIDG